MWHEAEEADASEYDTGKMDIRTACIKQEAQVYVCVYADPILLTPFACPPHADK